jgi:methylglutaconyl-CoA hydratase
MNILLTSVADGIGSITMNRAEKRNALSTELIAALHSAFDAMRDNADVRVIVLRGEGPAFCAGADLAYLQRISEMSPLDNVDDSTSLKNMFQAIVDCPKPVIAMVHGPAIAGGCGLATVCDIVVAARSTAVFGYSEVRIGFIPAIVLVYLVRKIGDTRARRLLLTAENIGADEARELGMISHVVDDENLEHETMQIARRLVRNSASAMAMTKSMLHAVQGMSLDAGLHYATVMNAMARQTDDCRQGISAFLNSQKGS